MYKMTVKSERMGKEVFTINLTDKQQKICEGCSATGFPINEPHKDDKIVCEPARLESILERIPTYQETEDKKIDMSSIPEGCPNKYKSLSIQKIR